MSQLDLMVRAMEGTNTCSVRQAESIFESTAPRRSQALVGADVAKSNPARTSWSGPGAGFASR